MSFPPGMQRHSRRNIPLRYRWSSEARVSSYVEIVDPFHSAAMIYHARWKTTHPRQLHQLRIKRKICRRQETAVANFKVATGATTSTSFESPPNSLGAFVERCLRRSASPQRGGKGKIIMKRADILGQRLKTRKIVDRNRCDKIALRDSARMPASQRYFGHYPPLPGAGLASAGPQHIQNSAVPYQSHSSKAATTFDLFPKLPAELRLTIWEMAVPSSKNEKGRRIIRGHFDFARTSHVKQRKGLSVFVYPSWDEFPRSTSTSVFDIGMAKACVESREVYLKALEHVIPIEPNPKLDGVVHFDKETTFYLCYLDLDLRYSAILDAFDKGWGISKWASNLRKLAVNASVLDDPPTWSGYLNFSAILLGFIHLEELVVVDGRQKDPRVAIQIKKLRHELKFYRKNYPEYSMPTKNLKIIQLREDEFQ